MTSASPPDRAESVGQWLEALPPDELAAWILHRFADQRIVLTTSFGMEGCVLVDLFARAGAALTIVYLDTMFFFAETYELRDRLAARYPQFRFVNRGTELTPGEQSERFGPDLWRRDPDRCCGLRRVEPMRAVLAEADIWITGVTRSQSPARAGTRIVEWDDRFGVVKVSPLARWDRARVWEYVQRHGVPFNPLHERGYPTIGCTHCTAPIRHLGIGEYTRAGRWAGSEKSECGLHGPAQGLKGEG